MAKVTATNGRTDGRTDRKRKFDVRAKSTAQQQQSTMWMWFVRLVGFSSNLTFFLNILIRVRVGVWVFSVATHESKMRKFIGKRFSVVMLTANEKYVSQEMPKIVFQEEINSKITFVANVRLQMKWQIEIRKSCFPMMWQYAKHLLRHRDIFEKERKNPLKYSFCLIGDYTVPLD